MKSATTRRPPAFWDTSALLPLCCRQPQSARCRLATRRYDGMVVWWGTLVEAASAFCRLRRQGHFSAADLSRAEAVLDALRRHWHEVQPLEEVRLEAERLLHVHALRGADALQLAAALVWCGKRPKGRPFVSADVNLLTAATGEGFTAVDVS